VEGLVIKSFKAYTLTALVLVGGLCFAAQPLGAHHSSAMFDPDKMMQLSGTIKELQWTNPHIWIQIDAKNAAGAKEEWSIEGGSPNSLSRSGWMKTTFKPGDVVTIKVNPMRDGSHAGQFVGAKFADGKTLGRWE
jgi:Family of unknown function (DUF6152)